MTFFSESDDYRERSLNIQMSQVNVDKQYRPKSAATGSH